MFCKHAIFFPANRAHRLFGACCGSALAVFRFGMFAVIRTDSCMRICAFIFYPFSEVVRIWIYCNRQFVKRCFRFVFVVLKNFVANRTFVMRVHAYSRASRFCFWNYIAVVMTERIAIFFPANRARRLFGTCCRTTCVAERRDFFIRCMIAPFALTSVVFFPAFFRAGCLFSVVMFQIMTERRNFVLCLQYFSAF